jgi:hypothetical protein
MKKVIWLFVILIAVCCFHSITHAQNSGSIFIKETPITWLGIDFSEAKYFGNPGAETSDDMKALYLKINYLVVSEPSKYNIAKCIYKKQVSNNLLPVEEKNRKMDHTKIISFNTADLNRLNTQIIDSMVANYNYGNTKGIGLVVIMETMDKSQEEAIMWVTFVNTETRKVIFTSKVSGKASGIGFRNHWAATIDEVFRTVYSKEYKKWQQNFSQKTN